MLSSLSEAPDCQMLVQSIKRHRIIKKKGRRGWRRPLFTLKPPAQGHALTRLATFTVPMPVAKSQPVAVP
jgi:hypothetical protein